MMDTDTAGYDGTVTDLPTLLLALLEAAALRHMDACEAGRWFDHAIDFGEFSGGPRRGEEECHDFLWASGHFLREYQAEDEAFRVWQRGEGPHPAGA